MYNVSCVFKDKTKHLKKIVENETICNMYGDEIKISKEIRNHRTKNAKCELRFNDTYFKGSI